MKVLRKCKECGLEAHNTEELELFVKLKKSLYGRQPWCKACKSKYTMSRDKERLYGVTLEEYNKAMETSVCCEICGKEEVKLCYDHNHKTNKFRGVLCVQCNGALGSFKDSPKLLARALEYLLNRGHYGS
jgi:hypothetical protein